MCARCVRALYLLSGLRTSGCLTCGEMHVCQVRECSMNVGNIECLVAHAPHTRTHSYAQDGFCTVEKNSEGHDICTITGMCVKMLSFSNEEFVDTACVMTACGGEDGPTLSATDGPQLPLGIHWEEQGTESGNKYEDWQLQGKKKRKIGPPHEATSSSSSSSQSHHQKQAPGGVHPPPQLTRPSCGGARRPMGGSGAATHTSSSTTTTTNVCSVNKKNRYRSWVYHRVMNRQQQQKLGQPNATTVSSAVGSSSHRGGGGGGGLAQDAASRTSELIQSYVDDVLCSQKWRKSMEIEAQKMRAKRRSLTLKVGIIIMCMSLAKNNEEALANGIIIFVDDFRK